MITLKNKAKCTKINKKSSSPAFKGICVGDVITFEAPVQKTGWSDTVKAVYITCKNERTNETSKLSFKQLGSLLDGFEFEEIL